VFILAILRKYVKIKEADGFTEKRKTGEMKK
jgi:hypothetical protein